MLNNIKTFFLNIIVSLSAIWATFAILEIFWLGWFSQSFYQSQMQGLLRDEFIIWPWAAFYLSYGCVIFVLTVVANRDKPWFYASIDGALLGLAAYGTYNLTNYSILEGFTFKLMIVDWCWGTFLTSVSSLSGWIGFQVMRKKLHSDLTDE